MDGSNASQPLNDEAVQKALAAPFTAEEIEWRLGATNKEKTSGIAMPYLSPKTVTRRLDRVLGASNWSFEVRQMDGGFIGRLSATFPSGKIAVRENFGANTDTQATGGGVSDGNAIKGGASDALKRSAVLLGIGRYFDDVPAIWAKLTDGGKQFAQPPKMPEKFLPKPEPKQ